MSGRPVPVDAGRVLIVVRCFAALRLAYVGMVALITLLAYGSGGTAGSYILVTVGIIYAVGLAVLAVRRPEPLLHWQRLAVVDIALVGAITMWSGYTFVVWIIAAPFLPILIALVARPLATFLWSIAPAGVMVGCTVVVFGRSSVQWSDLDAAMLFFYSALLVFPALYGAGFSALLLRLDRATLENARRELLAATIVRVEARERHELADALHDGPVQHLAAAYREMTSSARGGQGRLDDARASLEIALEQLRGEIFDLYPHVLDHAGLAGAVGELVRRSDERGGFTTSIDIDPGAVGIDDVTVMAVLRELLTNSAKHAEATHVDVTVSNEGGACLLVEVCDDGCGFTPLPPEQALEARHFGLSSMGDRLLALGGSLDIVSERGSGTRVRARIPTHPPAEQQGRTERRRFGRPRICSAGWLLARARPHA